LITLFDDAWEQCLSFQTKVTKFFCNTEEFYFPPFFRMLIISLAARSNEQKRVSFLLETSRRHTVGVEVQVYSFTTLALEVEECPYSCPRNIATGTHWIGGEWAPEPVCMFSIWQKSYAYSTVQTLNHPAHSIVSLLTTLSRCHIKYAINIFNFTLWTV